MSDKPSKANDIELELTIGDMFFAMKKQNETASTDPVFDTSVIRIPNIKRLPSKGTESRTTFMPAVKSSGQSRKKPVLK